LGINTPAANSAFSIYPNPSSGDFNLVFADNAKKTVTLINAMGQVVQRFTVADKQAVVAPQVSGLYFITVQDSDKVWSQKIIKQ
jgi:hypothetical protein